MSKPSSRPNREAIKRAIERSEFDYMKKHQEKFGDHPPEQTKVYDQFIRRGKKGEGKETFSEEQEILFLKNYNRRVKKFETMAFGNPQEPV